MRLPNYSIGGIFVKKTLKKSLAVMMVVVMTLTAAPLSGFVGMQLPEFSGVKNIAKSVSDFFSGLSVKAEAAETYSGTCGDNLTWSLDTETGVLEIGGTGAMTDYTKNYAPWYKYRTYIYSINICDNVTKIGEDAFWKCTNLVSITIGKDVATIGDTIFYECSNLTSIIVDENNEYYSNDEYGVLFNKDKTILIQYPVGNTRVSYTIPESTKTIGEDAFYKCESLISVIIPEGVASIGDYAFYWCSITSNRQ